MGYCSRTDKDARPAGGCNFHLTKYEAEREAFLRESEEETNDIND